MRRTLGRQRQFTRLIRELIMTRHSIRRSILAAALCAAAIPFAARTAQAEETAGLKGVHLCCKGCVNAVEKAVAETSEVKCVVDGEKGTVQLTAASTAAIQTAVDAIAAAGFHGKLDNKEVKWPKAKLPKGKVDVLEVEHVHNCCPACAKAIKKALAEVEGVEGDTCKPKVESFAIKGNFDPKAVMKALNQAGFHATVATTK